MYEGITCSECNFYKEGQDYCPYFPYVYPDKAICSSFNLSRNSYLNYIPDEWLDELLGKSTEHKKISKIDVLRCPGCNAPIDEKALKNRKCNYCSNILFLKEE